jgi:HEAT repeat protein
VGPSTLTVMRIADLLLAGERGGPVFDEAIEAADGSDVAAVLELTTHADPDVRLAVAQALPSLTHGETPTTDMVQAAIELSSDQGTQVRNWACFALGQQWREVDTDAVRDALAARLDDSDQEVRCEALVGLAYRHDARALPRVQTALSRPSGDIWRLELLAAGALSDPQLHDLVLRHQTGWDDDGDTLPTAELVRRLTDPAGAGDELLDKVAELYRRRAHGQPDGDAVLAWHVLAGMLDIAPQRAAEFVELVAVRLAGDEAAERALRTGSALAQLAESTE